MSRSRGAKTAAAAAGEGEGGAAEEMVREQDEVIRKKEEEIETKRRSRSASRPSSGRCSATRNSSPPCGPTQRGGLHRSGAKGRSYDGSEGRSTRGFDRGGEVALQSKWGGGGCSGCLLLGTMMVASSSP